MTRYLLLHFLFWGNIVQAQLDITFSNESELLKHGVLTYQIMDLETGEILAHRNEQRLVPPASTLKLVTTLSALEILGPDFRYETKLFATGKTNQSSGHLSGDIVLSGGGDPTLGSKHFDEMSIDQFVDQLAQSVIDRDIRRIDGNLIIEDAYYNGYAQNPDWLYRDLGNYYACGLWSLNVHDNMGTITFARSTKPGSPTKLIRVTPSSLNRSSYINEVTIGQAGSGDQAYIYGTHQSDHWTIKGTLPPSQSDYTIKSALSDVPHLIGQELLTCLESKGIEITGKLIWQREPFDRKPVEVIWSSKSTSLLDICRVTNEKSINLFAEALIQTIGVLHPDKDLDYPNSLQSGINYCISFWKDAGIDLTHWQWYDGSGLSPINGLTAEDIVRLIQYTCRQGAESQSMLVDILAEAGKEGTLKSICSPDSPLHGKLWAKSGTIAHTKAYTGVLQAKSGKYYGFYLNASRIPDDKSREVRTAMMGFLEAFALQR